MAFRIGKEFGGVYSGFGRQGVPNSFPAPQRLPRDHRLPSVYRWREDAGGETVARGELAREPAVALLEAALLVADEPLPPRKLAQVAGLKDATEARRLLRKLQAFYE